MCVLCVRLSARRLLLLVSRQAEEKPQDGFQISIPDLWEKEMFNNRLLFSISFGRHFSLKVISRVLITSTVPCTA